MVHTLPEISLDVDNFENLVLEYRNRISSIYPEWTDYNYHDPGITIVELFAWLKEIQQFHLDQIGEDHKMKYLKLLGMKRLYRAPAWTLVEANTNKNQVLLRGTKFYADEICFETEKKELLIGGDILKCITDVKGSISFIEESQLSYNGRLKYYPFGEKALVKAMCYIQCSMPLPVKERINLTVSIYNEYPVKRNAIDGDEIYPLAKVIYEYYCADGWKTCEEVKDESYALIQDGQISFVLKESMAETQVYGNYGYFMRIHLVESNYEIAPIITGISFNQVKVIQRESLCVYEDVSIVSSEEEEIKIKVDLDLAREGIEELFYGYGDTFIPVKNYEKEQKKNSTVYRIPKPLGAIPDYIRVNCYDSNFAIKRELAFGNGFPSQVYDLKEDFASYGDFEIMVEDMVTPGAFKWWNKVEDYHCSTPEDYHYCFDEEKGEVTFGNSIHGMAPEGRIIIISFSLCFGGRGNVKAGKINYCKELECERKPLSHPLLMQYDKEASHMPRSQGAEIYNRKDAQDGRDRESISNSFLRVRKMLKSQERAVTESDYERLVHKVPGLMIHSCKAIAIPEENAIGIMAKPFSVTEPQNLNQSYRNNILSYLDSRRLLGTKILIFSIEYIELSVCAEVKAKSSFHGVKEMAEEEMRKFLNRWEEEFGKPISYGLFYGHLDSLPYISGINSLMLEVKGNRTRKNQNGDIIPPTNGVFLIKNVDCIVVSIS